jgi:hypothetical protein
VQHGGASFGLQTAARKFGLTITHRYVSVGVVYFSFTVRKQDRVTDHRLGKGSIVSCEAIMEGSGLRTLIDELKDKYLSEALQDVLEPA